MEENDDEEGMNFEFAHNDDGDGDIDLAYSIFNELPEELIIKILSYLSPYTDTKSARLVNRKWLRLITAIEHQSHRMFLKCVKSHNIMWKVNKQRSYDVTDVLLPGSKSEKPFRRVIQRPNTNVPSPRFSHASVILGQYMYIFCGTSSEYNTGSTYNDLYRFDLSNHVWQKIKTEGLLPAPRECCTFVAFKSKPSKHLYRTIPYKGKLVVFAGVCQPPGERMHVSPRFFDDTQIFHIHNSTWQRVDVNDNHPSSRAGHSASVIGNRQMVIFGGSQRSNRLNDVWVFDIDNLSWSRPYIRGKRPKERFGQSQFTISDDKIAILGGCGVPNELFGDLWLLDTKTWSWSLVQVDNEIYEPPNLWCHESVMVNGDIVVFSEEKKCPYCSCPVRRYTIPRFEPASEDSECTCGRKLSDASALQVTQPNLQMYVLDCSRLLKDSFCEWTEYCYLTPSPPSRRLFSASVGINEILIFGGLQENDIENRVDDCTIIVSAKPMQ